MKDMMALAAERAAKVLGKVLPDAGKSQHNSDADTQNDRASPKTGSKKEQDNDQ